MSLCSSGKLIAFIASYKAQFVACEGSEFIDHPSGRVILAVETLHNTLVFVHMKMPGMAGLQSQIIQLFNVFVKITTIISIKVDKIV